MKSLSVSIWIAAFLLGFPGFAPSLWALARLEPPEGCYLGASIGPGDTIAKFSSRVGLRPAVYTEFFSFPLTIEGRKGLQGFFDQVRPTRGIALITLEPSLGLSNVTEEACQELVQLCADGEDMGIGGIFLRFGHEMNGSWYAWGQKPVLYKEKFCLLAKQVHARTARTAMLWAPSYGGGYPFGSHQVLPGTPDFVELDTDADGEITDNDDCYEPYYPGNDAVDWVGLTLYHWGVQYPWLENELPEPNSFAQLLTGTYRGGNGNQTAIPDFYARYSGDGQRNKPLAIPETAAFFNPHQGGASEVAIKRSWCRQLFNISGDTAEALDVALHFPKLKSIGWFDHYKFEPEPSQWIDWRIGSYEPVRSAFVQHMRTLRNGRPWFLMGPDFASLQQAHGISDWELPRILPLTGPVSLSLFVKTERSCDLIVELLDQNLQLKAGTRVAVNAATQMVTLNLSINEPLRDGSSYSWGFHLVPTGGNPTNALATCRGLPTAARAISPVIHIIAFPPILASPSNFTVRVKYSAPQSAVAVVNLLDSRYQWRGGGEVRVSRGHGILDVPVVLSTGLGNGTYVLESFLSSASTNWQNPMARSPNFSVRTASSVQQDFINVIPEPAAVPAGEVFRFTVDYAAVTNRDLHIDLFDANTNFLAGASQSIPAGSGIQDMTLSVPLAPPGKYFVTAFCAPRGQSWTQAVAWSANRAVTVRAREYQQWIESYWSIVLGNDSVNPEDDPDADGVNNADEFSALTDPRLATDVLKPQMARISSGLNVFWRSVVGRRYQLWQSSNLSNGSWRTVGETLNGTGALIQVAVGAGNGASFYRVQVLPP